MLAFACAFTMFAGAAFTDQADIEHSEAVDMLNSLGVIGGYPDGSFHPEKTITRAEMAKMIFTIRNGGNTDASAYTDVSTTFTDISGHWAEGYIKYCQVNGIISGKSAYRFDPEGEVTVVETAKMALIVMGYKADRASLTGAGWDTRTLALATDNSLLDQVVGSVTAPIIRGEAAQLLFNTVNAECVVWSNDVETFIKDTVTVGETARTRTVGTKYLGLQEWIGTFEGNSNFGGLALNDGQIQVNGSLDGIDKTTAANDAIDAKFKYDIDLSLIGEEVKVLFKDGKGGTDDQPDDKDTIYGIYATGNTTVYNITAGDLQDGDSDNDKIKFGDKEYKADADNGIDVIVNYDAGNALSDNVDATEFDDGGDYYGNLPNTIKFIAEDGKINAAYVNTYTLARVTAVNSDKVSINNGVGAIKIEDNDIYEGVAKDDIVVVQTFYDDDATSDDAYSTVTKAEVVSAELTGYKGTTENVTFDGTTYKVMGGAFAGTGIDADFEISVENQIGETYDFYMIGGYVAAAKLTSDGAKNYAVVTGKTGYANNKANPLKVAILNAAGEEMLVEVDTDGVTEVAQDNLISYSVINDSKIKIKEVHTMAAKGAGYVKDTKTFDGVVTAADAPLFVKKGDDYYVYTIRNLNDTAADDAADDKESAKITDDGKVVAALIVRNTTPSGASADTVYGIVSDNKGSVKIDGTYYTEYAVDTFDKEGTAETKKVLVEGETDLAKGELVSFDVAANDVYSDGEITVYTDGTNNATATWVKEYDPKGAILTTWNSVVSNGTSYVGETGKTTVTAFDDDAVIAFVSVADDKGTSDNGVPEFDGVTGYKNAMIVVEDSKIVGMFVDTDNNILGSSVSGIVVEDGKTVIYGGTATVSEGEAVVRAGNVTLSGGSADVYGGTVAMSGGEAKAKGGTFTVTGSSAKIKIGKEIGTPITITIGEKTLKLANYTGDVVKAVENGAFVADLSSANSGETWIYRDSSGKQWIKEA